MNLNRVTITGADDSVPVGKLIELSVKYPFVEWGILFSTNRQGTSRFPSRDWLNTLWAVLEKPETKLNLCAHLCGKELVRDFISTGRFAFPVQYPSLWRFLQRVQINFHAAKHNICWAALQEIDDSKKDFIVQYDGVSDEALEALVTGNHRIYPLFDTSGGVGRLPSSWPQPIEEGAYCGYAGGLGPVNVLGQLYNIASAAGGSPIWIDMESRVRSDDNRVLDMDKVESVLKQVAPFITE